MAYREDAATATAAAIAGGTNVLAAVPAAGFSTRGLYVFNNMSVQLTLSVIPQLIDGTFWGVLQFTVAAGGRAIIGRGVGISDARFGGAVYARVTGNEALLDVPAQVIYVQIAPAAGAGNCTVELTQEG